MDADNNLYQPFVEHIPLLVVNHFMHKDIRQLFIVQFASRQNNPWTKEANHYRGRNQRIAG